MVQIIHLANTDVEFEYERSNLEPIFQSWSRHPLCLQLQYLPLLYAEPHDWVAVTSLPDQAYLDALNQTGWWAEGLSQMVQLGEKEALFGKQCLSWGPSRQVQAWAEARRMSYDMPSNWDAICTVNSKAFSFRFTALPGAALLKDEFELSHWLQEVKGAKVLKTCYGLSGIGNRHMNSDEMTPAIRDFCQHEWQMGRPVIGEPWLDRLVDFSTQWFIRRDKNIELIGATRFETDRKGIYRGTSAGPAALLFEESESFLGHHCQYVQKPLQEMVKMGFFGHVGCDAFLYREAQTGSVSLNPLVEINGRQTMSLVALRMQRRLCPQQVLKLAFHPDGRLLPDKCPDATGKMVFFKRNLKAEILPPKPMLK